MRLPLPPGGVDCMEHPGVGYRTAWAKADSGCGVNQFRRHFAFVILVADGKATIVVQAALIQSRWDYLRLNWNKKRSEWFWPYAGVSGSPGIR